MTRKYRRIFAATLAAGGLGAGIGAASAFAHDAAEAAAIGETHAEAHDYQAQAAARVSPLGALAEGSALRTAVSGPPSLVGQWASPVALPPNVMGIHAVMMPTGKVLWFGTKINPSSAHNPSPPGSDPANAQASGPNGASAAVWDPTKGASGFKRIDPSKNIWCAGQSLLSDGSVLVTGGTFAYSDATLDFRGSKQVATFDPFTETWNTSHPDMRHGRWYPTQVELDDGKTLISSGNDESGTPSFTRNLDFDVFTPGATRASAGSLRNYPDARGGAGEPPNGAWYPHHFLMPSGRVLTAGPWVEDTWRLNTPKTDATNWTDVAQLSRDRNWGTGVLVPQATPGTTKVLLIGGASIPQEAQPDTELYDEAGPDAWVPQQPLQVGRAHHNTVLLPDGSMVTVGGGVGRRAGDQWVAETPQKEVELWNPATGQWTLGPAQAEFRAYHSTALLLPDGRVVSAGDDVNTSIGNGIQQDTYELYSPPYLFNGARPSISFAPTEVRYGAAMHIGSPDANVTKAVLIAPGATTHANDMNQRYVPVSLSKRADGRGYDITAPSGPTIAPPGYYMLFLLNSSGVPSVAKFIRLHPNAADAPDITAPPDPPGNLPGSKIGSRVSLGSFEVPRLAPWTRKNAAVRVRGGSSGKYSVRLTGLRRKPAMLARRLPSMAPGEYVLVFSIRDGRAARVIRTSKLNEVRLATGRRGWRKVTLNIQVNAGTPPTVRFRMNPRRSTRIDNVYIVRVS